ncbi:MAG TPA: hypothetical protein VFC63_20245 [Blastocatellia bacterium]|nr:hypothetical protein [Blastocatellia bacterium]
MKIATRYLLFITLISISLTAFISNETHVFAQSHDKLGVMFKTPKGYMPLDFPDIKGVLMITQKKPEGLYIVYPTNEQTLDDICKKVQSTIKGMFVHDNKVEVNWSSATLPKHEGVEDETGTLWLGSTNAQNIQIAMFIRKVGSYQYVYGHFAMMDKSGKSKEQNGAFLDKDGKGVKEFDEFWRSISKEK